ncbi:Serine/threonine-protein kinase PknB [Enhygromyxa salina]|uniref:non-specific serine/threonine protein kinase n=2 Tax=Enhygromyxa salina TaxID=215803 RepID=A0A2S9XJ22_9BACT|nr:Serine/threonine-protein kinase PknB [Enhygromyxa salina]
MIEAGAEECWHCGATIEGAQRERRQLVGANTASGAPTVPVGDLDLSRSFHGPSMIGREVIGQYVIRAKLGEGGMGEVYLADQAAIGRQVAIKIVHAQIRERDVDDHVTRFRNEAKAAASLESPHIVQIFNWGELDDGTLFMAMEYLSGQTLAQVLREQGPLDAERCVDIATQICAALTEAHGAGIIHRDLKPSNIMLIERADAPGQRFAKVLDFGVAKLEGSDITRSGAMFGTPQYMSPEQLRAEGVDGRSDLYSLGVMLYEMLVGELPFASPTAIGFITAHLHDEPPPLPSTVPRALAEVVMLLLAKNPDERPADAAAVAFELRAALTGRSPAARRRARRKTLRRALVVTLSLVGLAALGLGGWQLWQSRAQTEDALALERARARALEQQVREQQAAVAQAREEARARAEAQLENSTKVREQRREVQDTSKRRDRAPRLDNETRALLTRSRAQLERQLGEILDGRRIPPSEVADVWRSHATRVAALDAGEIDEDDLREELVSMIALYRKNFDLKRRGDQLPLAQLEARFLTMATKSELGEDERRALLDAVYETFDNQDLPDSDRAYFKRLEVAKLIREHEAEPEPEPEPEPKPKPKDEGSTTAVAPGPGDPQPPAGENERGLGELPAPDGI